MACENNPCARFVEMRDRSERRGDELHEVKRVVFGYVNDWRTGVLSSNEAMISISTACEALSRTEPQTTK